MERLFGPDVKAAQALVVGANGGIGLGVVRQLLSDSHIARIYGTYHRPEAATELLAIAADTPDRLTALPLDVTDEAQVAQTCQQVQSEVGHLHLVMNTVGLLHAGELQPEKSLSQINPEHLLRYFQVNSMAGVLLAKHLLPVLRHRDRSILATISAKIGSIGDNQLGGWYGYRASKAALNMFLRTAAIEYKRKSPHTIIVALHPGTTDTPLSQPFQRHVPPDKLFSVDRTVRQLLTVLANLEETDSGEFFSWDGSRLPW